MLAALICCSLLFISEIQLVSTKSGNVAAGKQASGSGELVFSSNWSPAAENAVDGCLDNNIGDDCCFVSQAEYQPWLCVDLGSSQSVDGFSITPRDCCPFQLQNYTVYVSEMKKDPSEYSDSEICYYLPEEHGANLKRDFDCLSAMTGRYVTIVQRTSHVGHLAICEFQVVSGSDDKLADSKPVHASSVYDFQPHWSTSPSNAVDGCYDNNVDSNCCFNSEYSTTPWLTVDLGANFYIESVAVTPSSYSGGTLQNYNIYVSEDPTPMPPTDPNTLCASVPGQYQPRRMEHSCKAGPITGRYVTVVQRTDVMQKMVICELEAYATNVAAKKQAYSSSLYHSTAKSIPGHAVDQCTSNEFDDGCCFHSNTEREPWWSVDLTDICYINSVRIWSRISVIQLGKFTIYVHNNDTNPLQDSEKEICAYQPGPHGEDMWRTYVCSQPLLGRYVSIVQRTTAANYLVICEVEVECCESAEKKIEYDLCSMGEDATNVAANKQTYSSSLYQNDAKAYSSHAVDQCHSNAYTDGCCFHSDMEIEPWWSVELTNICYINSVRIWSRNGIPDQLQNFTIYVHNNGFVLQDNEKEICAYQPEEHGADMWRTYVCSQPLLGRYVSIVQRTAEIQSIVFCEVEVNCCDLGEKTPKEEYDMCFLEHHEAGPYLISAGGEFTNMGIGYEGTLGKVLTNPRRWYVRSPGNNGASESVSLESVENQGYYLRYQSSDEKVYLQHSGEGDTGTFNDDSTWYIQDYAEVPGYIRFESARAPGTYIRHTGFVLHSQRRDQGTNLAADWAWKLNYEGDCDVPYKHSEVEYDLCSVEQDCSNISARAARIDVMNALEVCFMFMVNDVQDREECVTTTLGEDTWETVTSSPFDDITKVDILVTWMPDKKRRWNKKPTLIGGCLSDSCELIYQKSCPDDIPPPARDCADHQSRGETLSGVYSITTTGPEPNTFDVYCDMDTDGGGWIVFQKRFDGSVDFYRNWTEYQDGFGSLTGEFWLGLDKVSYITDQGSYEVRFDLEDYENDMRYAVYDAFSIDRNDYYRLDVGAYNSESTAGNSLSVPPQSHDGMKFTTYDNDQDVHDTSNCAEQYHGAWWYRNCHHANLNGDYGNNEHAVGVNWLGFRGYEYSLKRTEIKIRPAGYEP